MRAVLQKLYFITWIRLPVKFILTFAFMKTVWDYSEYLTKWRTKNTQPRWVHKIVFSVNLMCSPLPIHSSQDPITGTTTTRDTKYYLLNSGQQALVSDDERRPEAVYAEL
jgi:hypothetical protein